MATEEQMGYRDAIRQVHRALEHRYNQLKDESKGSSADHTADIRARMQEVRHILEIVDSLHR